MLLLGLRTFELGWFVSLNKAGHMLKARINKRRSRYCTAKRDLLKSFACFVIYGIEDYQSTTHTFRKFLQIFPRGKGTLISIYLVYIYIYIFVNIYVIYI